MIAKLVDLSHQRVSNGRVMIAVDESNLELPWQHGKPERYSSQSLEVYSSKTSTVKSPLCTGHPWYDSLIVYGTAKRLLRRDFAYPLQQPSLS